MRTEQRKWENEQRQQRALGILGITDVDRLHDILRAVQNSKQPLKANTLLGAYSKLFNAHKRGELDALLAACKDAGEEQDAE
jgi:hypothetical protein